MEMVNNDQNSDDKMQKIEQVSASTYRRARSCQFWVYSVLAALIAVAVTFSFIKPHLQEHFLEKYQESARFRENGGLDAEGLSLFLYYDKNMDGQIDMEEFVLIANRITMKKEAEITEWDWSGEHLTVKASFTPLVLSSMSKLVGEWSDEDDIQLKGLKLWQKVCQPVSTLPVNAFSALFLPPKDLSVEPGQMWYLVHPNFTRHGPDLSSQRYFPPTVHGPSTVLYHLLALFHPRPFLLTRFGPQGSMACVRAQNREYLDISFRIHAEFQLNTPPLLPFWLTPGQFSGSVVIRRDGSHINSFQVAVPNNRSLNVDMEWLVNDRREKQEVALDDKPEEKNMEMQEGMESNMDNQVDIGFLPQMELHSTEPSSLNHKKEIKLYKPTSEQSNITVMEWDSEITQREAQGIIEEKFYPFKKVPYLSFEDVFKRAHQEHKLVHHILLWGALDDQSC